ncbi:MAG: glycosyltransferase family 4 protein [Gammaproteobacteria bacterium]
MVYHYKKWRPFFRKLLIRIPFIKKYFFIPIDLPQSTLLFSKVSLKDDRGMGRLAREWFSQLQALSKNIQPKNDKNNQTLYFYPSIHWCPTHLPKKSIVGILDVIPLIFPNHFSTERALWENYYTKIAKKADFIVTISESSAKDIVKYLNIPKNKVKVIYCGATQLDVTDKPTVTLPSKPYLVYLSSFDYHKNLKVVLNALKLLPKENIDLVVIGANDQYQSCISDNSLSDRVHLLGRLEDEQVGYVINHALTLVCPSLYEGFGLPPFEAALLDTPSICSRRPAMTELLENAAFFAEPDAPEEWAKVIRELLENPDKRNDMAIKAKTRAKEFTWERSGKLLFDFANQKAESDFLAR